MNNFLGFVAFAAVVGLGLAGLFVFRSGWRAFVDSHDIAVPICAALATVALCWVAQGQAAGPRMFAYAAMGLTALASLFLLIKQFEFKHDPWVALVGCVAVAVAASGCVISLVQLLNDRETAPARMVAFLVYALAMLTIVKCWSKHVTPSAATPLPHTLLTAKADDGASRRLVVFVHGFGGPNGCQAVHDVIREAEDSRGGFDVLAIGYLGNNFTLNLLSNQDPADVTNEIVKRIGAVADGYEHIYLAGHSMGAILARKAFLQAHGASSDAARRKEPWADRVERIVMLAGLNRGMNIEGQRPSDMSAIKHFGFWLGSYIGDLFGIGTLSRSTRSGSPFIANMRMDWVRLFREASHPRVKVVQLLGDIDDLISEDDAADFRAQGGARFYPLAVRGTGHAEILDMRPDATSKDFELQQHRRRMLELALGDLDDCEVSKPTPEQPVDDEVRNVLIVLHGIRDLGRWAASFTDKLAAKSGAGDGCWRVEAPRYGYFGMGPFLLKAERGKYVRWLMDQVTEIMARYPKAQFDFFGHSNGTYLLAKSLKQYVSLHLRRVVFAGSVVDKDYRFAFASGEDGSESAREQGTVEEVVNLKGSTDWVVATFPSVFDFGITNGLNPDVGQAGFGGFATPPTTAPLANIQIEGSHGAFSERIDDIVDYHAATGSFAERVAGIAPAGKPNCLLRLLASGGQFGVFALIVLLLVLLGAWFVAPAGPYSRYVAIAYVVGVGWVLSKL